MADHGRTPDGTHQGHVERLVAALDTSPAPAWSQQSGRQALGPGGSGPRGGGRGRPAAVLALLTRSEDPEIVLTRRPATMRHHAGQVALPGGRAEPGDRDVVATALREASEEVGLDPTTVKVAGRLQPFHVAVSSSDVTAVVATWDGAGELGVVDPGEVASVHRVALSVLADPAVRVRSRFPTGQLGPAFALPDLFVWGFTGHLLDQIISLGGWQQPWDRSRVMDVPRDYLGRRGL